MNRDDKADARIRQQEEQNTERRAQLLGLRYLDTRPLIQALPLVSGYMTIADMRKNIMVPLLAPKTDQNLTFGITINTPQPELRRIREANPELNLDFYLISNSSFRDFMLRYDPPKEVHYDDVKIANEGDSVTISQVSKTLEMVKSDELLDYLIDQSFRLGASDIHVEPQKNDVRIRFRVDGALHPVATLSHDKHRVLLAALASRANISFAGIEAQTGHLTKQIDRLDGSGQDTLNMRIETVPTVHGQDAVIRLFNFDESLLNLDQLGLTSKELREFRDIVGHPHGMVMVVGPTGSGKSTTLYSIVNALNESSRKILTLEDPVEFSIPGISQIPVSTQQGDSFADKLRAVLRLDPDVVMVGEIRDIDTARTAVQASITGHLVLTTFHANSAATALSRMIDMIGVNPIFSTAIRLIIGQRLVRRLDDASREAYEPDDATKKWLREVLRDLPPDAPKVDLDNLTLYRPVPTESNPFGYKGRIVLMEQMIITEDIQKFLRGDASYSNSADIEQTAKRQGMMTLLQQGVLRALDGETTIEEVNRVI